MPQTVTMRQSADGTYTARPDVSELDGLAHWLDSRFSVFGVRFGLDNILGIVPGIGDVAAMCLSLILVAHAYRLGARKRTIARMLANVAGDTALGSIPVVGSVIDVVWKSNRANMQILREELERPEVLRRH